MLEPVTFEAPTHQTLFFLEAGELRIITYPGEEVLLLVGELVAFLLHVSAYPPPALTRVSARRLHAVAAALSRGGGGHHG